jgi:hypothetical protein
VTAQNAPYQCLILDKAFLIMNQPKYQIGDRIPDSPFTVCGLLTLSNGSYRYFIQVANSDNTFVGDESDIEIAIDLVSSVISNQ